MPTGIMEEGSHGLALLCHPHVQYAETIWVPTFWDRGERAWKQPNGFLTKFMHGRDTTPKRVQAKELRESGEEQWICQRYFDVPPIWCGMLICASFANLHWPSSIIFGESRIAVEITGIAGRPALERHEAIFPGFAQVEPGVACKRRHEKICWNIILFWGKYHTLKWSCQALHVSSKVDDTSAELHHLILSTRGIHRIMLGFLTTR